MPSVRLDRLFGSTSTRLAAIYAALMLAAFVIAGFGAWFATKSAVEHQIRERIALEMRALQEEIRIEGQDAAIAAIRSREESPGALEYRLTDAGDAILVGDLRVERPSVGWTFVDLPDAEAKRIGKDDFVVLTQVIPGGGALSIGDDLAHAEQVRAAVLGALVWVGGVALVLALAAGVIAGRGALRRMDALSHTMDLVGAGDLSARAPEREGGDDIDNIGRGVNRMLARINALVQSVRRVSNDIAHDLRTPLTHVRQALETAAASQDPAAMQDAIRSAQAKTDDVLRVFAAMLRLSEIEAGAARSRFSPVELGALAERVADAYRPDIEVGGRALQVGVLDEASIVGDADLIAQALANLIENAIRYTPPGAVIALRVTNEAAETRIVLQDNGPGIAQPDRTRALVPFGRLDASRSSRGAGLGLSIVHAIARLHGAELRLEDATPGLVASLNWARELQ